MSERMKPTGMLANMFNKVFHSYCWLVVGHPITLLTSTIVISVVLSAIGIILHYDTIDFDPGKGFETRGTTLSEGKLILDSLSGNTAEPIDIYKTKFNIDFRHKRESLDNDDDLVQSLMNETEEALFEGLGDTSESNATTLEPISINYDDYGVNSEPNVDDLDDPCTQYASMGRKVPYDAFDILAKVIVGFAPQKLFTVDTFKNLCEVDSIVKKIITQHNQSHLLISQIRHSFNLPYISTCLNLSSYKTCAAINQKDIDFFKNTLDSCQAEKSKEICNLPMMQQVLHYLLPKDHSNPMVAIVLNVQRSSEAKTSKVFDKLQSSLETHFQRANLKLKGVDFGNKSHQFLSALFFDSLLSIASVFLVLSTFLIYSRSIFFTIIICAVIILSMTLAFFTYTVILGINFFPFINLLVLVLMTSVGADDAFLLLAYYREAKDKLSQPWKPGDVYLPPESLHVRCLQKSLKHSLISMFITSATTAVAFLSNLSSEIIVLRCFGIYACLTVSFNYFLVICILPSTIMLTHTDRPLIRIPTTNFITHLSNVIGKLRYILCIIAVLCTGGTAYTIFVSPGLRLPMHNPTTLLVGSNPHEWFDNNAYLFDFEWKRTFMIQKYFIVGKMDMTSVEMLSPYSKGKIYLNSFIMDDKDIDYFEEKVSVLLETAQENSWISGYRNFTCEPKADSKCYLEYSTERLPLAFPDDYSKRASDGPLFDKKMNLIGYYFDIPSNIKLTAEAKDVQEAFNEIKADCSYLKSGTKLPVRCLSSSDVTRYYDILERLWPSTMSSVAISIVVSLAVVILCTRRLLLSLITVSVICAVVFWTTATLIAFGWQLSVVESTILVLTIGLSFDFSLHIAASVRDSRETTMLDKVKSSLNSAGTACTLAALSSVLCGIPLFFSRTAAFQQVGMLLVALGAISLLGAVIVLPAALLCLSRERKTDISHF